MQNLFMFDGYYLAVALGSTLIVSNQFVHVMSKVTYLVHQKDLRALQNRPCHTEELLLAVFQSGNVRGNISGPQLLRLPSREVVAALRDGRVQVAEHVSIDLFGRRIRFVT